MKKIFNIIFSFMLLCTLTSCNNNYISVIEDKDDIININDLQIKQIIITDNKNVEVENMTLTYEKNKLIKIDYYIYEEDNESLESDLKNLEDLNPVKLVNKNLQVHAVFEDETLEERFMNYKIDKIDEYINLLKEEKPEYKIEFIEK